MLKVGCRGWVLLRKAFRAVTGKEAVCGMHTSGSFGAVITVQGSHHFVGGSLDWSQHFACRYDTAEHPLFGTDGSGGPHEGDVHQPNVEGVRST